MSADLLPATTQPVYVLGAGFSAAISNQMPLTNDIGKEVQRRLAGTVDVADLESVDFEDWLSIRVSPMPFLEGHENQRRLADAQQAIAVIADIIEERTTVAASQPVPLWLRQLIAIWHVERALVVTFNYDNLLERAVNDIQLTSVVDNHAETLTADDVVFPAPVPPPAVTYADMEGSNRDSLQVLKVHGSINWYWNAADPTGSSLTRSRERSRFENLASGDRDFSGIGMLDRFLIPPVATKGDYYTPPLTKILWRIAGSSIRHTSRLTLFGYSMPPTDRATTEMLRGVTARSVIDVIDRYGDVSSARGSVLDRAREVFAAHPNLWAGDNCAEDYVEAQLAMASQSLLAFLSSETLDGGNASVIVGLPAAAGRRVRSNVSAIAFRDGELRPYEITDSAIALVSGGSAAEAALNSQPHGSLQMSDFVVAGQLHEMANTDGQIVVVDGAERWVAIGAETMTLNRSRSLRLHLAPLT